MCARPIFLLEYIETAFLLWVKKWPLFHYPQIPYAVMVFAEVAVAGMRYNKL